MLEMLKLEFRPKIDGVEIPVDMYRSGAIRPCQRGRDVFLVVTGRQSVK